MNFRIFVESMTIPELNELRNAISDKMSEFYKRNQIPCDNEEKELVKQGQFIKAIKNYRARLNCSLLEAKIAIDSLREN